mgnify:CR=1 FL=1
MGPKVLIAKVGLDEHYFGALLIARALRDAGMEVILIGGDVGPRELARTAAQEDVDVVGISMLIGNYMYLLPECVKQLREEGKGDVLLICGGMIDERDYPLLMTQGVSRIWGPGTPTREVVSFIQQHFRDRPLRKARAQA